MKSLIPSAAVVVAALAAILLAETKPVKYVRAKVAEFAG